MPLQKTTAQSSTSQKSTLQKSSGRKLLGQKKSEQDDYTTKVIKDREAMMNCLNYLLMEIEDAKLHTVALHLKIAIHELEDITPIR